jgi:WD40 repeat protein
MKIYRLLSLLAALCPLAALPASPGDDLPSAAAKRVKEFEAEAEAIREKANDEANARHDKLIADLENLKKEYTKSGDLDAALAIRERIRQLKEKPEPVGEVRRFEGHEAPVHAVAFSPDGRLALSGTAGGPNASTVRLWDVRTGHKLRNLDGHSNSVFSVAFSPDGKRVLSCSEDSTVRLWNAGTGKELKRLEGHRAPVYSAVFSPDGKRALTGGGDKTVRLWDLESGKELLKLGGHNAGVPRVAFSPDGRRALSGGHHPDPRIFLWNLETGALLKTLDGHASHAHGVAFLPDGERAISCSFDGTIRLWDLESGKQIEEIKGRQEMPALALSPDGRRLVTAGFDQTVRLWDLEAGRELQCFFWHAGRVLSVALSPNGRYALSGGDDRLMRLWRLPDPEPPPRDLKLTERQLDALWTDLASDERARAYDAARLLRADPARSVPFLREHVKPNEPGPDEEKLQQLLADLDSEEFPKREAATKELERLGPLAEDALKRALAGTPSAEFRGRAERLLKLMGEGRPLTPEQKRDGRAVRVLEQVGTPEAHKLLEALAKESRSWWTAKEAREVLERLDRRGRNP